MWWGVLQCMEKRLLPAERQGTDMHEGRTRSGLAVWNDAVHVFGSSV